MALAHDAVPPSRSRRLDWLGDNPLVRAIGRIPLPLGGKLLLGFTVVAALLAVIAALGLVALNQSNSRGEQLRSLQQTAAFARVVEAEATQLSNLVVGARFGGPGGNGVRVPIDEANDRKYRFHDAADDRGRYPGDGLLGNSGRGAPPARQKRQGNSRDHFPHR